MADIGLVLAAGAGTRFGQPKAPVVVEGERLIDRSVRVLRAGGCDDVVVVLGAWVGSVPGATVLVNDSWQLGMGTSLEAGLRHLLEVAGSGDRVAISLVDLPGLTSDAVARVRACTSDLVVATDGGRAGHPVVIAHSHWEPILKLPLADQGARLYLTGQRSVVRVEVGDVADLTDLDHAHGLGN